MPSVHSTLASNLVAALTAASAQSSLLVSSSSTIDAASSSYLTPVASSPHSILFPSLPSLSPIRLLSFLRRLALALGRFLSSRLRRLPIVQSLLKHLHSLLDRYNYDSVTTSDTFRSHILDQFIRATRVAWRLCVDALTFANWTLNPILFVRRLYRFCVGLIVLYIVHTCVAYLGERFRRVRDWYQLERGAWYGDTKCARKYELDQALATAQTYEEWRSAAAELDELEQERMVWKRTKISADYQYKRIAKNVESIRNLIASHQQQQQQARLRPRTPVDVTNNPYTSTASIATTATSTPSNITLGAPNTSSTAAASASTSTDTASTSSAASSAPSASPSLTAASSSSATFASPRSMPSASPTRSADPLALMSFLRSRLFRNIGNITNTRLYFDSSTDHFVSSFPDRDTSVQSGRGPPLPCRVGTKQLIEEYHAQVIRGLETILTDSSIPPSTKLSFFRETRHAYGRSALLLNGGSNLGMLHLGVVKALLEIDVLPQIISGSSVGAIFAALICSRTDAELSKIGTSDFIALEFPSVRGSLRRKLRRFLEEGILMDISALIHCVRSHIGDLTFEQAYQRYGRILNIVVTPIHLASIGPKKRTVEEGGDADVADDEVQHSSEPILLNYLTAPSVLIWSAACASCAVPHLYAPVELLSKNPQGQIIPYYGSDHDENVRFGAGCTDGQVAKMDVAMDRLRTLFNANNFIVSQLNLSLLPFIFGGTPFSSAGPIQKLTRYIAREIYQRVTNLCCLFGLTSEYLQRTSLGRYNLVRIALYVHSLTSQKISGDVTLIPPVSWRDYSQLLENPSTKRLNDCVDVARRYTWTKGSLIKAHCVVEFALDRCVRKVRDEMGLASVTSASHAAFAHPNRNYVSTSPFQPSSSHSTTATPVPTSLHWSKKLNARALQPPRRGSFTSDILAGSISMPPTPSVIPPSLDLNFGRNSPFAPTPIPIVQSVLPSRINTPSVPSSLYPFSSPSMNSGPVSAPATNTNPFATALAAATAAAAAAAARSLSPSAANSSATLPALMPVIELPGSAGSTVSAPRTAELRDDITPQPMLDVEDTLDVAGGSGSSSSSASNSPHASGRSTPLPADSSRDDLAALSPSPSVSRNNASHLSQSTMSPSSRPASTTTSMVFSKLLDEPARQQATNGATIARSDSLQRSTPQPTSAGTSGGQSLLRAVPSLPGRNPSSSTILPTSSSIVRASDSFNNGVMAHLNQQMMFTMPVQQKKPIKKPMQNRTNVANGNGTTTTNAAVNSNKNPSDDSSSICPSTSGSESNSSDVETTSTNTTPHAQQVTTSTTSST